MHTIMQNEFKLAKIGKKSIGFDKKTTVFFAFFRELILTLNQMVRRDFWLSFTPSSMVVM